MRRQFAPSHLKVPPGPTSIPQRFLGASEVVVNHYSYNDKLIPAIPGFRTSAAFLTSLSANLTIDPDCPSPLLTPTTFRSSNSAVVPPLLSSLSFTTTRSSASPYASPVESNVKSVDQFSAGSTAPTDDLPTLITSTAETDEDRATALRLVADSIAQQRQTTSKMLMLHPANLAAYLLTLAIAVPYVWHSFNPLALYTTIAAISTAFLALVAWAPSRYANLAHDIDGDWLGDDKLIVVKWGEELIGALVLGWAADCDAGKKRSGARRRRGKAVVRAWTVALKCRRRGVGEALLAEAVKVAGEQGANGIAFDRDHANSKRILPSFYNGYLDKKEEKAMKALSKVADEKGNFRQRRSSSTWGSR